MFFKKIVFLFLFVSLSVGGLPAADEHNLTDTQLHAVLGIITGFILSDVDSDGDGVLDSQDAFPHDATETVDTDGDGIGNNADTDDDGDGALDVDEVAAGTDPLNPDDLIFGGYKYKVVTSPYTGHKWLDRNLGASQVCTSFDDAACYGEYYQWGRDVDGHEKSGSATTDVQADMSPPGHNKFIKGHNDWVTGYDHNYPDQRAYHWSQRDGSSVCPVGFRVPTQTELKEETLNNGVSNRATAFSNFLKFPSAGRRYYASGSLLDVGAEGIVWTISHSGYIDASSIGYLSFNENHAYSYCKKSANGLSIRCMKPIVSIDTPPVLHLRGSSQREMMQFSTYPIIRVIGVDDVDGIIVPYVVATDPYGQTWGLLNTSISGVHTISYTATDSAGQASNTVIVTVTIHPAIKKTGQTIIYDKNGTAHTHAEADSNASLRDDGYYQKGHVPLYVRDDGDEIVTDNITGLQWQDNAAVADSGNKKRWLTETNYDICTGQNGQTQDVSKCTDTSGTTAASYCDALVFGGHEDWRLPSVDELGSILDRGKYNPAVDTDKFHNVASSYYWSSTTDVRNSRNAWFVSLGYSFQSFFSKNHSTYVRCVRVGQ
jgi:hypothetical protein